MRLFTAVSLDATARGSLERAVDAAVGVAGGPRWSARDLWHVTLVFFGEVPDERLPRLRRELAGVGHGLAPFTLQVTGAGTFPVSGPPRVLWAGLSGDVDRLAGLVDQVRRAARRAGVQGDRKPYHPHLTLGRWRPEDVGTRDAVQALAGYAGPPFQVGEFTLFCSHLGASVRHEPLDTWPLAG